MTYQQSPPYWSHFVIFSHVSAVYRCEERPGDMICSGHKDLSFLKAFVPQGIGAVCDYDLVDHATEGKEIGLDGPRKCMAFCHED